MKAKASKSATTAKAVAPAAPARSPAAKRTAAPVANTPKAPSAKPAKAAKSTKPAPAPVVKPTKAVGRSVSAATPPAKVSSPATAKPEKMAKTSGAAKVSAVSAVPTAPKPRTSMRSGGKSVSQVPPQAAMTPTHAPDAAKATFSPISERVMTPSVTMPFQKDPKRVNNWKTLPVDQLTDADVLAMPDGEYMNDVQLAFFRRKLQLLKADMLANAGETTEHLREDTVVVPDPADRATIEEEHALELRTRDRERKLLKKIEQAIARIDSGDYGYCEETGEPIGVGRLMARPTASLSLEAQQRRELKQKMFGD